MRLHRSSSAVLAALSAGLLVFVFDGVIDLPWPKVASRSLAGLFLLSGLTRALADAGLEAQKWFGHATQGVAITAAIWFIAAAIPMDQPMLFALGGLYLPAALLATPPGNREPGWLVASIAMCVVSLLGLAILHPLFALPSIVSLIVFLAAALLVAQGRGVGPLVAALGAIGALLLVVRVSLSGEGNAASLLALTTAIGAVLPLVAATLRLPTLWRLMAPTASPALQHLLSWLTLPAVAILADVLLS